MGTSFPKLPSFLAKFLGTVSVTSLRCLFPVVWTIGPDCFLLFQRVRSDYLEEGPGIPRDWNSPMETFLQMGQLAADQLESRVSSSLLSPSPQHKLHTGFPAERALHKGGQKPPRGLHLLLPAPPSSRIPAAIQSPMPICHPFLLTMNDAQD